MKSITFYLMMSILICSKGLYSQVNLSYFYLEEVSLDSLDLEIFREIEIDTFRISEFNIPYIKVKDDLEKEYTYYSSQSSIFFDNHYVIYKSNFFKLTPFFREIYCHNVVTEINNKLDGSMSGRPISVYCPRYFEFYDNGNIKFRCVGDFDGYTVAFCYDESGGVTKIQFYKSNEVVMELKL